MAGNTCLGIYCTPDQMTAVLVDRAGPRAGQPVLTARRDELDDDRRDDRAALCQLLADRVHDQYGRIAPVALALDSSYYQSQTCVSPFEDLRQIRQTIRFDIEEEFAIDAEGTTIAYRVVPADQPGTGLMVYTANTATLRDLFHAFEDRDLDALSAEPEIEAWHHWLTRCQPRALQSAIALAQCGSTLYLMVCDAAGQPRVMRSFPAPAPADLVDIAAAEIRRSVMLLEQAPDSLYYHADELDDISMNELAGRLEVAAVAIQSDPMEAVLATGTALGLLHKQTLADFRQDNLPSRTARRRESCLLWTAAGAACVFCLVWIAVVYSHAGAYRAFAEQARKDIHAAWTRAIPDRAVPKANIDINFEKELRKLQRQFSGGKTEYIPDSASRTLTQVLRFLNHVPDQLELQIEKLSVNPEGAYAFSGSIKDLAAFDQLREILRTCGVPLEIDRSSFEPPSGTIRSFNMPLRLSGREAASSTASVPKK